MRPLHPNEPEFLINLGEGKPLGGFCGEMIVESWRENDGSKTEHVAVAGNCVQISSIYDGKCANRKQQRMGMNGRG